MDLHARAHARFIRFRTSPGRHVTASASGVLVGVALLASCGNSVASDPDAAVWVDTRDGATDAAMTDAAAVDASAVDAPPADAGPLGPMATPIPLPLLGVRDIALSGDTLVAVGVNNQGRLDMVACPGAGCTGAPVVLATNQPVSTRAIEADAQRAYWTTDLAVVQVSLDGQARANRFDLTATGGRVEPALLRVDRYVYFAAFDNLRNQLQVRRIDGQATTGTSLQADLSPAGSGPAITAIGGGDGTIATWFDPSGAATSNVIRVKAVAGGAASERAEVATMRGTNSLAVAGGGVFWVEDPAVPGPDLLGACSLTGACTPVTLFTGVTSAIGTDGTTIFFSSVRDQQAILLACDAAQALASGTCDPTIVSADVCWLGARRLRVTSSFVYGVSQAGAVCRIPR